MNDVILDARITKLPEKFGDPMPKLMVTLKDGSEYKLFEYYSDEISFNASEFIGLTTDEAMDLKRKKDITFIQS